jgi:hypothetical protein
MVVYLYGTEGWNCESCFLSLHTWAEHWAYQHTRNNESVWAIPGTLK